MSGPGTSSPMAGREAPPNLVVVVPTFNEAENLTALALDLLALPWPGLRLLVAVGSRYVPGGQVDEDWGFDRLALSRSANALSRLLLGLKTRDATAGFKAWRRSALESLDLGRVRSNGYLFQEEMAYLCERLGLRIREVPIRFSDRRIGRSKMTLRTKLEAAFGLVRLRRRHRRVRPIPDLVPRRP